ncbi:MAG: alpha/beta hydrolase [Jiangellaceae bacterium]|nr:alpha/beta hydrolase [Jiangellaceae bacterium]
MRCPARHSRSVRRHATDARDDVGAKHTCHAGSYRGRVSAPPFLDLPDGVCARRVSTDRAQFAALEAGSAGPAALFVPGWTGSKEDFIAVLAPVAAAGFRAVAYDQRGQYETPGTDAELDYTLAALAADLLAVVQAVSDRPVHLVGHSFGGLVARGATIADPGAVASLTLLCSGPGPQPVDRHQLLLAMADAIPAVGLPGSWQAKRAYERSLDGPELAAEIEQFMQRRFLANHPLSLRAITLLLTNAVDDLDALAATRVSVQIAFGAADDGWPLDQQRAMAARLGAPVAVIEGAGHSPAAERPAETVAALVRFWADIEPGQPRKDG